MGGTTTLKVLPKAARLLTELANHGELSVPELAKLTGEPKTTVYRFVGSLEAVGFVERGAAKGTYRVGLRVLEIGSSVLDRFSERQAAQLAMRRLHDATEQTVHLCLREGDRALCIDRIEGRWVRSMALRIGGSLPLHIGAGSRILLAYESPDYWAEYIASHDVSRVASHSPEDLTAMLKENRMVGYAISSGDTIVGIAGIAAPIFDYHGDIRASISMSGPSEALLGSERDRNVRRVVDAATEISRLLGYRDVPTAADTGRHLATLAASAP